MEPPGNRSTPPPWRLIAALLIFAAALIPFDGVLSRAIRAASVPGEVNRVLSRVETFGHGAGVVMIALTIMICMRPRYRPGLCAASAAIGAGMTANGIKMLFARTRPSDLTDLAASTSPASVFLKYDSPQAFLTHISDKTQQSFPSAHSATAFGLAVALTVLFPRGRYWFTFLAVLVGMQRIVNGAHYVSDVLIGAAVGLGMGSLIVQRFAGAESGTVGLNSTGICTHPATQSASDISQAA